MEIFRRLLIVLLWGFVAYCSLVGPIWGYIILDDWKLEPSNKVNPYNHHLNPGKLKTAKELVGMNVMPTSVPGPSLGNLYAEIENLASQGDVKATEVLKAHHEWLESYHKRFWVRCLAFLLVPPVVGLVLHKALNWILLKDTEKNSRTTFKDGEAV